MKYSSIIFFIYDISFKNPSFFEKNYRWEESIGFGRDIKNLDLSDYL